MLHGVESVFPNANGHERMWGFFARPDPRGQNNEAAGQMEQQRAKTSRSVIEAALLGLGHPSQTLAYNGGQQ